MKLIYIDLETTSTQPFGNNKMNVGLKNYATSEETYIYLFSYAVNDGPVKTIYNKWLNFDALNADGEVDRFSYSGYKEEKEFTKLIEEVVEGEAKFVVFNKAFECEVMRHRLGQAVAKPFNPEYAFDLRPTDFICVQQMALSVRGGNSLEQNALYFKTAKKMVDNSALMKRVAVATKEKPKNSLILKKYQGVPVFISGDPDNPVYMKIGPEAIEELTSYCVRDVEVTRELYKKLVKIQKLLLGRNLPLINKTFEMTDNANSAGIALDMERLEFLDKWWEEIQMVSSKFAMEHFGVPSISQRAKVLKALQDKGYGLTSLAKDSLDKFLLNTDDKYIHDVLKQYAVYNKSALSKASSALRVSHEGYLYWLLNFCGASTTGRFSSRGGFNLQNIPSCSSSAEELEEFYKKMKDSKEERLKLENIERAPELLRSCVKAYAGENFFIADLSQIELRLALYHGGYLKHLEKLDKGIDLYSEFAGKIYGVDPKKLTKKSKERKVAKEAMLSLQYGSGADSFRAAVFKNSGLVIPKKEAQKIVGIYRREFKNIIARWNEYDNQLKKYIDKDKPYVLTLKSGRKLQYPKIQRRASKTSEGKSFVSTSYLKGNLMRDRVWGGIIFQHQIQAEARDLFMYKLKGMYDQGYTLLMTVHDEAIYATDRPHQECIEDWAKAGKKPIEATWKGLPLASETEYGTKYR